MQDETNPSKSQTAQRIRENQRRSRDRKRQYVASLERRLKEFEQQGVQANIELQKQARLVLEENRALRSLLKEQCDLDERDIDSYLTSHRESKLRIVTAAVPPSRTSCCGGIPCPKVPEPLRRTLPTASTPSSSRAKLPSSRSPTMALVPSPALAPFPEPLSQFTLPPVTLIGGSNSWDATLGALPRSIQSPLQASGLSPPNDVPYLPLLENEPRTATPSFIPGHPIDIDDSFIMGLVCTSQWPPPTSSPMAGFTSCDFAFQLIKALNQRRYMPMKMSDIVLEWLWHGMRSSMDPSTCCVVDAEVLYSIVMTLLG